jgi:hypothetical protein
MRFVPTAAHKSLRLGYHFERLHSPLFPGSSCCRYLNVHDLSIKDAGAESLPT